MSSQNNHFPEGAQSWLALPSRLPMKLSCLTFLWAVAASAWASADEAYFRQHVGRFSNSAA